MGATGRTTPAPHSAIGMRAPIEHEQAYTPPPQEEDADNTDNADAEDVGEQTTTNQPQPATTPPIR